MKFKFLPKTFEGKNIFLRQGSKAKIFTFKNNFNRYKINFFLSMKNQPLSNSQIITRHFPSSRNNNLVQRQFYRSKAAKVRCKI